MRTKRWQGGRRGGRENLGGKEFVELSPPVKIKRGRF